MTKLIAFMGILSIAGLGIMLLAFFFGFKANTKKIADTAFTLSHVGLVLMVGSVVVLFYGDPSVWKVLAFILMYAFGCIVIITTPLTAVAIGLAEGEKFDGQYQRMTPAQRETFWAGVRSASKAGAGWFSKDQRRRGNHGAADAASFIRKFL
jgi:hypothetical protein